MHSNVKIYCQKIFCSWVLRQVNAMAEILRREFVYVSYYFMVQFRQIFFYWIWGMVIGSCVSVFAKKGLRRLFARMSGSRWGLLGAVPASILGILSPLCMYGTIPVAASFAEQGMRQDWLAAFMMSSALLNPQLMIYSMALGRKAAAVRFVSCFLCGIAAGLLTAGFCRRASFFCFDGFSGPENHDTDPNPVLRLLKNFGRNLRATGPWFVTGVLLSALFQRYVPAESLTRLFGRDSGWGVLLAATVGVPLYVCGGGTIPLLQQWLTSGMSLGSAASFMITGPATKITNLGALKTVLGIRNFLLYLFFVMIFSLLTGAAVQIFL